MNNFFSIVLSTKNSEKKILDCLKSIKRQSYKKYEIIVIDCLSEDKTIDIIKSFKFSNITILSEKDKGIYDAINKGIRKAKGDIISILHSDDAYYTKNILKIINKKFITSKENKFNQIIRYWKSSEFKSGSFLKGWSPPHPSFFVKKKIYNKYGLYKTYLGSPADIELMYRYLQIKKIKCSYMSNILVKMRYGGESTISFKKIFVQNLELMRILKINNNILLIIKFLFFKFINRFSQIIKGINFDK